MLGSGKRRARDRVAPHCASFEVRRDVNCDTVGRGRHYCKVIREIRATGLDWNRLVLAYHRFGCPRPIRHHARLRVPLDVVQQKACVGA